MMSNTFLFALALFAGITAKAQMMVDTTKPLTNKPEETEVFPPQAAEPKVVKPGNSFNDAPSDAVILFNGKNLDQWVSNRNKGPDKWTV
jgi:hypothetical protein